MKVLFPSQPFEPRRIDSSYEAEREAAHHAGLATLRIDLEGFERGLVFREYVELEALATHSKSGMPLAREYRSFILDGRAMLTVEYREGGDYRGELPPEGLVHEIASRVESRFFTMDLARRRDGDWLILELGDAQVAGLPEGLGPERFYRALAEALGEPPGAVFEVAVDQQHGGVLYDLCAAALRELAAHQRGHRAVAELQRRSDAVPRWCRRRRYQSRRTRRPRRTRPPRASRPSGWSSGASSM